MNNHKSLQICLETQIAGLESRVDMLETEIAYLNNLLIQCGFPEGTLTLKAAAQELIDSN